MDLQKIENYAVRYDLARMRSSHQMRVDAFMRGAQQPVPYYPQIPSTDVRMLRARLIFEEALELINGLGVEVSTATVHGRVVINPDCSMPPDPGFTAAKDPDIVEVVDGCLDVAVVTTGTLTAFGVSDMLLQTEVDENNLAKFAPGYRIDEGGKLVKPPHHPKPIIAEILNAQLPEGVSRFAT